MSYVSLLDKEDRKKTVHKSGSSNPLVDRTKSIVKLIIFVFSLALKVVLPNNKVCACEKSAFTNNVWSMLTKMLRSGRRLLLSKREWRKKWLAYSTSLPQLRIGLSLFWKVCFNLCSRRWLNPGRIHVIYLIPIGLWQIKIELEEGRMYFNALLLKTLQLLHLHRLGCNLFHAIIAEGKKEILKKLCLVIKLGI